VCDCSAKSKNVAMVTHNIQEPGISERHGIKTARLLLISSLGDTVSFYHKHFGSLKNMKQLTSGGSIASTPRLHRGIT
jgi:hypothetical protein